MRILYVTTISLTMNSFFKPHVQMLVEEGHQVDIACNYNDLPLDDIYKSLGCIIYQVDFSRSPLSLDNVKAYKQLNEVVKNGKYDVVHCHTPNASVITRLVCKKFRKNGLQVFYTAHGFHFYKGAPKMNWMIFYPIEKICSRYTDKIITINQEDYELARNKFYAKEVCYIPGVGVDISKFENVRIRKDEKKKELGLPDDAFVLLSVGELNDNKNHQIIIKALDRLGNSKIHYVIAGDGVNKDYLSELAIRCNVKNQIHLLGYRNDICELNYMADVFCFPSLREGLGIAAIEAMACGVPLLTSDVHGINDYNDEGVTGYKCSSMDVDGFSNAIEIMRKDAVLRRTLGENCVQVSKKYDIRRINRLVKQLY